MCGKNSKSKINLSGYDHNGQVFEQENTIFRKIETHYKPEVIRLFERYQQANLRQLGIVSTQLLADGNLEHEKLTISYPFEWPANMFKDAALFHLELFRKLETADLVLKDALPNNILFRHTTPLFVDFLSLVFKHKLKEESWLNSQTYADDRVAVLDRMAFPFLAMPILAMAADSYGLAREFLSSRSCNSQGRPPSLADLFLLLPKAGRRAPRKYIQMLGALLRLSWLNWRLKKNSSGYGKLLNALIREIQTLDVTPRESAYADYYAAKNAEIPIYDPSVFQKKQAAVHQILTRRSPRSVLDIGANTGWYSFLAAATGAQVIALEQDESCADILYKKARENRQPILPLKLAFGDLTKEYYGRDYNDDVYQERDFASTPLYRAAVERFESDMVLVLGLAHHLVLGEGRTIEQIFEIFSQVTRSTLILEFVALDDEKITNEPSFFPNIKAYNNSNYNLEKFLSIGKCYFSSAETLDSQPASRKLLVFEK